MNKDLNKNEMKNYKLIIDDESEQMAVINSDNIILSIKSFGDKDINDVLDYLLEYDTLYKNEDIKDIDYCLQNNIISSDKLEYQAFRVCSKCNKIMFSGYVVDYDVTIQSYCSHYYCSDECLYKNYTEDEYLLLHKDIEEEGLTIEEYKAMTKEEQDKVGTENCQAYWTEWN